MHELQSVEKDLCIIETIALHVPIPHGRSQEQAFACSLPDVKYIYLPTYLPTYLTTSIVKTGQSKSDLEGCLSASIAILLVSSTQNQTSNNVFS